MRQEQTGKTIKTTLMGSAVALAMAFSAGCASTTDDVSQQAQKAATQAVAEVSEATPEFGNGPAMWRMADADSEIYLFGTFHLLPADLQWVTDDFTTAMAETETTYTEADVTSPEATQALQAAVQKYGLNPPGVTLSGILGPERAAKFDALAQQYGLSMAQLEPVRPWLASLTITQIAFQQSGFKPEAGAEATVLANAAQEGDTLAHFESAESQIIALASLDELGDFSNFDEGIAMLSDFDGFANKMLEIWKTGDIDGLVEQIIAPTRESSEEAFDIIFENRNANWVEQLDVLMNGEGDYFIAVGAGHLVGDDSVVDMLRKRGYTVERVQ